MERRYVVHFGHNNEPWIVVDTFKPMGTPGWYVATYETRLEAQQVADRMEANRVS